MYHPFRGDRFLGRAREWFDESKELAETGTARTNEFIHAQPLLATLLGVAAGYLIARMLPWRRSAGAPVRTRIQGRRPGSGHAGRTRSRAAART